MVAFITADSDHANLRLLLFKSARVRGVGLSSSLVIEDYCLRVRDFTLRRPLYATASGPDHSVAMAQSITCVILHPSARLLRI